MPASKRAGGSAKAYAVNVADHTAVQELAKKIRESWPHIGVLFMSGYNDDDVRRHGLVGARDSFPLGGKLASLSARFELVRLHRHNERDAGQRLLRELQAGRAVALVADAGTPGLSDPGAHAIEHARGAVRDDRRGGHRAGVVFEPGLQVGERLRHAQAVAGGSDAGEHAALHRQDADAQAALSG